MAFRQPTFAPASRPTTAREPEPNTTTTIASPLHRELDQSQEWILFPSAHAHSTTLTQTASTERTPRTAGLSRFSDFGSLAARSGQENGAACAATDGFTDEDGELDSLDEGLHAFQEPPNLQRSGYFDQSGSILPRHDGLGTFPASSPPMQEQLWHFEQYNPRKRSINGPIRRRSSVQRRLDAVEDNDAAVLEGERRERIERWRTEQSKLFLDEIEKETRRRRRSSALGQRPERTPSTIGLERIIKESVQAQTGQHPTNESKGPATQASDDESFWQRITRRLIRDFIGLDDATLSIIFGESLPTEQPVSSAPTGLASSKSIRLDPSSSGWGSALWEGRLLDRISRELGILVQQLSDHPGAFSTPHLYDPSTSDYAGMHVTVPTSSKSQPKTSPFTANLPATSSASFNFNPTLQDARPMTPTTTADSAHAALWGIEEEPSQDFSQHDRDYWEQSPDLKTVFRFLHTRFTAERRPSPTTKPTINIATTSTPDSLRRAAVIRQYHPLVSRAATAWEQRHGHTRRHSLLRGRNGSSCASSIAGSARRAAGVRGSSLASSSRNYWDIGGSGVGSGVSGGVGAWGEV